MNSLFSICKLIGNKFFDSFFDTISPGKIGAIVKPLILLIGKRVKEINQIFIWDKTIELSCSDNGIVATGHFCAFMGDGKQRIISSDNKWFNCLSLRKVVVKLKTAILEHILESLAGIEKVLDCSSNPCLL